jgi:hypothetical protein
MSRKPSPMQRWSLGGMLVFAVVMAVVALLPVLHPGEAVLDPTGVPRVDLDPGVAADRVERPNPDLRTRTSPPEAEGPGGHRGIHVEVRWDDGEPARGVAVALLEWGRDELLRCREITDEQGLLDFGDPPSGHYAVVGDRGGHRHVVHRQGDRTRVELALLRRETVDVLVVDEAGVGLAAALVHLAGVEGQGGTVLGATAADGRLAVPGLRVGQKIWASQRGFAPSSVHEIEPIRTGPVTLVVGRASGTVVVSALDSVGARVVTGIAYAAPLVSPGRVPTVRAYAQWQAFESVRGASDRGIEVFGLPPGDCSFTVVAPEHAPWTSRVEVPTEGAVVVRAELVRGATVAGVVRDASGATVGDVVVSVVGVPFRRPVTADAVGAFELLHVPPGDVTVSARDSLGEATARLTLADGERRECSLVLARGVTLRGRYVDERGAAIPGLRVMLRLDVPGDAPGREVRTAADGGFVFERCVRAPHRLAAYPRVEPLFPAKVDRVVPGPETLTIVLPREATTAGSLVGSIVGGSGPDGAAGLADAPVAAAIVRVAPVPMTVDSVVVLTETDINGSFEVGPLAPGDYSIDVKVLKGSQPSPMHFHVGDYRVSGSRPTVVGSIRVPMTGGCEVVVAGVPEDNGSLHLVRGAIVVPLRRDGSRFVGADVPVGRYQLQSADGLPPLDLDVEIPSGDTTRVEVAVASAVGVDIVLSGPARDEVRHHALELRGGSSGRVLLTATWKQWAEPTVNFPLVLLPGVYEVRVITSDGCLGQSTLLVGRQRMRHEVQLR